MTEYIDKQAAIDATDDKYSLGDIGRMERDIIVDALEYALPADVRPVVRGKWKKIEGPVFPYWRCTACQEAHFLEPPNAKFCPHCGADMREGDTDG